MITAIDEGGNMMQTSDAWLIGVAVLPIVLVNFASVGH